MTKIIAMAGSARKNSFNKDLLSHSVKGAIEAGADVELIDMNDYPLPLYHGDEEEENGLPENAKILKKKFMEADGFLFSSPEYNSSVSGAFKNLIDWVSRPEDSDPHYLCAYKEKIAAIMSASPGGLGGLRGLVHFRDILENMGTLVLPDQVTVPSASNGIPEKKGEAAKSLGRKLVETAKKL